MIEWTRSETPIEPTGWHALVYYGGRNPAIRGLSPGKEYYSAINLSQDGWVSGGINIYTKETLRFPWIDDKYLLVEVSIPEEYRNKVYTSGDYTKVEGFKVERFCDVKDSELWKDQEYCEYAFKKKIPWPYSTFLTQRTICG